MSEALSSKPAVRAFRAFALFVLVYTIGVIVFGAWVRVTGSGAGCGQHWPTCEGEIIPRSLSAEKLIEFSHRITSGLCMPFVLTMWVWARRIFPKGHLARPWSFWTVVFMATEALLGASLVIFRLVEDNDSVWRAVFMPLHLVNTFLLTGAVTKALWWGAYDETPARARLQGGAGRAIVLAAWALVIISMTGAITALGDTLYPVVTGEHDIRQRLLLDGANAAHFLVYLRIVHPILAVLAGLYVATIGAGIASASDRSTTKRWGYITATFVLLQLMVGFMNISLSAPGWMQLTHLGVATALWCSLVAFSQSTIATAPARDSSSAQAAGGTPADA